MSKTNLEYPKMFDDPGIAERVNECKKLISEHGNPNSSLTPVLNEKLTKTLYILISDGVKGIMKKESILNALEHLSSLHADVSSLIPDIYNVFEVETSVSESSSLERTNLACIVKHSEKFLSDRLLKERLENEALQELKVVDKNYQNKFIKVKTKLYYKQKKFNLFREECEGYAKLITELNQRRNEVNTAYMMEVIKSLIGCFNLDPNRVLDVILDSFENHYEQSDFFIPLLKAYMPQSKTLSDVLGFKYVHYIEAKLVTPKSLYIITAFLLQHHAIYLDDMYGWLQPDDNSIAKDWEEKLDEARKRFKENNASVISRKETENDEWNIPSEEELAKRESNQKFGLLEALLRIGEWKIFKQICCRLPQTYIVSLYPIAYNMCQLIHLLIDPVYRKYYESSRNLSNIKAKTVSNPFAPKQVTTFLELRNDVLPMLYTIGSYLSYDPELVYKVIRILRLALVQAGVNDQGSMPTEDSLYFDILTVMDLTILPTLSALQSNCCVADEIWDVLKLYPYNFRYALYSRWKNETTLKYPIILYNNCEALKKIKEIMKKITKETTKLAGRQIGKLTHSSPGCILEYILNQIMMFDNLILLVVESLKYLTGLTYDVLAFSIIDVIMQPKRSTSKQTNGTTSSWLVNLSVFCGSMFKKYNIELVGILQYVCNQMKVHKSFDLLILKEIIQKMSGTEFSEDMTSDQLSAFSGGEILRSEGGSFTHVRSTRKSSSRLKDALMENNLAVSLCLLIAQQRDCIVYKEKTPSKLAGDLYDQCQDILVQCGTFLTGVLSIEDYVLRLPPIESLLTEYHLRTDAAFFLSRLKINFSINAKFEDIKKADPNSKRWTDSDKMQKYYAAVVKVTSPIIDSIQPLYPAKVWDDIAPKFIILFWSISMYDLEVPVDSYHKEITKIRVKNEELKNSKESTPAKLKKEQERNLTLVEKLKEEMKRQQEHVIRVQHRLLTEKDTWFKPRDVKTAKNETITQFLQHCLFPRCIFTTLDAIFCAKFIHLLHSLKTPNFSTLLCYDRLFCDIVYSVTLCTENEARRYGRFLCAVFETVMRWHSNKEIFDHECAKFPGFITKYRVSNQFSDASEHVGYENYRHVCHKWHYKITKALVVCLESKDFIQIRNALTILIKILPHFPVLVKLAQIIEKKVEKIIEDEKKESRGLTTLAVSYNGLLKARSSHFIREQDFHLVPPSVVSKSESHDSNSSATAASSNPSMSIPISVVGSKESKSDSHDMELSKYASNSHAEEKIRVIDLVTEDMKNESRNSYDYAKSKDDYVDRDRSGKEEKRETMSERKSRDKRSKEEKLLYDDRKDDYRSLPLSKGEEVSRSKSSSYRSESSNSWPEYASPRDEDAPQHKLTDAYERGEGELKRRKPNSSASGKLSKIKSVSNSPEPLSPTEKKEKRSKTKRSARSSSVVIDLSDTVKEKKRESASRKRLRAEDDDLMTDKKKKSDERSKSHQNGDDLLKMFASEKHHGQAAPLYTKAHERKSREKQYSMKEKRK